MGDGPSIHLSLKGGCYMVMKFGAESVKFLPDDMALELKGD